MTSKALNPSPEAIDKKVKSKYCDEPLGRLRDVPDAVTARGNIRIHGAPVILVARFIESPTLRGS